jgi:hypothetical protein
MLFECNTCLRYEKLHHGLTHRDGEHNRKDRSAVTPKDFPDTNDQQKIIRRWYDVLRRYTMCKITMADDRLPALSGIASRVHERTGDTYVAGIWRSDMLQGLSWRVRAFLKPYVRENSANILR